MLSQILDTWSLRPHIESNKTLRFLGGSPLGVIRESPMMFLTAVIMSGYYNKFCWSSFNFKRLLVIYIFVSFIHASQCDVAASFDTDAPGWNDTYN